MTKLTTPDLSADPGEPLASLEALLALRPAAAQAAEPPPQAPSPPAPERTPGGAVEILQASPARVPPFQDNPGAELLFIHAGTPESTLAQAWMRRVLDGAHLHSARFQSSVPEQVLLLVPHVMFIHFDVPVIELATRLVAQLRDAHPQLPVVAVGRMKHAQCTLAALRAGVRDFLDLDGPNQAAQATVQQLLQRSPEPSLGDGAAAPLTAILAARAGLGTSLLAAHLAWHLQLRLQDALEPEPAGTAADGEPLDALLIDLGSPHGDSGLYLDTPGDFSFVDAARNLRRFDRRLASSGLARHVDGLRLLALPRQQPLPHDLAHASTDLLMLRLRQYFRHVVADLGAVAQTDLATRVALRANRIWVVCDQSIASVVSTVELLRQLIAQKADRSRMQLIVNRYDHRLSLDAEQISRQLQLPLLAVIPERRATLAQSVNQGRLLPARQRSEPYVQAIGCLVEALLASHRVRPASTAPAGGLGRIVQRLRTLATP